ncbi:MAG TPA: hypothetical protein VKA70_20750 [Blastocatellia bacterium]|nr:hypothetical protein [Blastocatellia bacterium]
MKTDPKPIKHDTDQCPQTGIPAGVKLENPPSSLVEVEFAARSHSGNGRPADGDALYYCQE